MCKPLHDIQTRIVIGSVPKDGGTFTFYRSLRDLLLKHGMHLHCVSVGRRESRLREAAFADDGCILLAPDVADVKEQSIAFVDWCEREAVDIVIGLNSIAILSALPHLPERVRVISRCANAFDHGYRITMSGRERLARMIVTTPRLKTDLVNHYGADESQIELLPNGISPGCFDAAARVSRGTNEVLRLGFLGRLEHNQKGVFYLPKILRCLKQRGVRFQLRIAGKGVHRNALENALKEWVNNGEVVFVGALQPSQVPAFFEDTDLYLFTSRFEGCPNALLEAMMAGCVPISWTIDGITDFIVEDGRTGSLSPIEDYVDFADNIATLDRDRARLQRISESAAATARDRFSSERAAATYAEVFREVMQKPPPSWRPRPWDEFLVDQSFVETWPQRIAQPVKSLAKYILSLRRRVA